MRKIVTAAVAAAAVLTGLVVVAQVGAAQVEPPAAPAGQDGLPPGWTVRDRELVWPAPALPGRQPRTYGSTGVPSESTVAISSASPSPSRSRSV